MNNLKAARESMGLTQKELASMIKETDPRIDVGMVSRFEIGVCLPTPVVARAFARCLSASVRDLFSEEGQTYIQDITLAETPVEPLPFAVEDLLNELHELPRTRKDLCRTMDISDRRLRRLIREAREHGYVICNNGRGYYLTTDENEMVTFYKTERRRALSILQGLSVLRKHLKALGVNV